MVFVALRCADKSVIFCIFSVFYALLLFMLEWLHPEPIHNIFVLLYYTFHCRTHSLIFIYLYIFINFKVFFTLSTL